MRRRRRGRGRHRHPPAAAGSPHPSQRGAGAARHDEFDDARGREAGTKDVMQNAGHVAQRREAVRERSDITPPARPYDDRPFADAITAAAACRRSRVMWTTAVTTCTDGRGVSAAAAAAVTPTETKPDDHTAGGNPSR